MSYYPEPYTRSKIKIKMQLNLSNYACKSDLEIATSVNTSNFDKKFGLGSLK